MNANVLTALDREAADLEAEAQRLRGDGALRELPVDGFKPPADDLAEESECQRLATARAAELAQMYESLQRRERLLAASANASRILLEAPDVMAAVPHVLRQLGEAAAVDRVNLMLTQTGPRGERLLVVASEWVAEGVVPHLGHPTMGTLEERDFARECAELRAGRSVCIIKEGAREEACGCALEGVGTKTKAIVPMFIDGEYVGVVGFDSTRQLRSIDSAELSALEMAAGIIGAALHRERLVDAVRRERERAAEERVAELARSNASIRSNLERLAKEPDLQSFLRALLLEATRQVDAAGGSVVLWKEALQEWRILAYARNGEITEPTFPVSLTREQAKFDERLRALREPQYLDLTVPADLECVWPGTVDMKRLDQVQRMFVLPLLFGERTMGCIALTFRHREPISPQACESLLALSYQATLAIELTVRAHASKTAAVLVERNRIGQEIHDGLAQAFTGILMQLGAAEELKGSSKQLNVVLGRIRDLAKEGLTEARRSVLALRPEETRRGSLTVALTQLAERSTVPGRVTSTFEGGAVATGLPPEHEHALLRIAQEAVANAVRHANPKNVRIVLKEEPANWELSISDDGVGMEGGPELCAKMGFGLENMRDRARAIGGEWRLESKPGEGTRISVRVPKRASAEGIRPKQPAQVQVN
ncbi:MAG TPA: GAF domain-containing sensor histidine kinase [Steroidobacteraceae bacterium]|nr:GAF domain-containing sensor histidine kinase [Steroidobacteraceae bacterium]